MNKKTLLYMISFLGVAIPLAGVDLSLFPMWGAGNSTPPAYLDSWQFLTFAVWLPYAVSIALFVLWIIFFPKLEEPSDTDFINESIILISVSVFELFVIAMLLYSKADNWKTILLTVTGILIVIISQIIYWIVHVRHVKAKPVEPEENSITDKKDDSQEKSKNIHNNRRRHKSH